MLHFNCPLQTAPLYTLYTGSLLYGLLIQGFSCYMVYFLLVRNGMSFHITEYFWYMVQIPHIWFISEGVALVIPVIWVYGVILFWIYGLFTNPVIRFFLVYGLFLEAKTADHITGSQCTIVFFWLAYHHLHKVVFFGVSIMTFYVNAVWVITNYIRRPYKNYARSANDGGDGRITQTACHLTPWKLTRLATNPLRVFHLVSKIASW